MFRTWSCVRSPALVGLGLPMSKYVRECQVVPATTLTHFNHIYPEFTKLVGHLQQLTGRLYAPGIAAQLVTVHVRDVAEALLPADRAGLVGRLTVVLRRPEEVGVRVAGVID